MSFVTHCHGLKCHELVVPRSGPKLRLTLILFTRQLARERNHETCQISKCQTLNLKMKTASYRSNPGIIPCYKLYSDELGASHLPTMPVTAFYTGERRAVCDQVVLLTDDPLAASGEDTDAARAKLHEHAVHVLRVCSPAELCTVNYRTT